MRRFCFLITIIALLCAALCLAEEGHEHVWTGYSVITDPTCTQEGLQVRICTICNQSEYETLAKADHQYGEWTYYSDTQHVRYCTVCGDAQRDKHDAAVARTVTQAQNARLGKKSITCSACKYNYTRFASVYDKLYSMEADYTRPDGSAYIKVNTITVKQGAQEKLTLYSDQSFTAYASTELKLEVYANAETGEYRGVRVESGEAVFKLDGSAGDIEFIDLGSAASASLEFNASSASFGLCRGETYLDWVMCEALPNGQHMLCTMTSALDGTVLRGAVRLYLCPTGRVLLSSAGLSPAQGQLAAQGAWSYNAKTAVMSLSFEEGSAAAYSSGKSLLGGRTTGTISAGDILWGWYLTWDSSEVGYRFVSPTYTDEGKLSSFAPEMSIDTEALIASQNAGADQPDSTETVEPADPDSGETVSEPISQPENPNVFAPGSVFTLTTDGKPLLSLHYENGVCDVRASAIPNGLTLQRIELVQKYVYGGFMLQNAYSADASFTLKPVDGSVSINAYFTDKNGQITCVSAGSFEYIAG